MEHRSPGSGLGLAIVRAIVTAHAGRIDVNSQIDRGATFRITLPRGVPEAA
ncbi:MAG TPA: ATP-binding protein [Polyangia bacterium]|nr:ATP-binding protein [Polyangia bacterium]